jgi:hypothetical protein
MNGQIQCGWCRRKTETTLCKCGAVHHEGKWKIAESGDRTAAEAAALKSEWLGQTKQQTR